MQRLLNDSDLISLTRGLTSIPHLIESTQKNGHKYVCKELLCSTEYPKNVKFDYFVKAVSDYYSH